MHQVGQEQADRQGLGLEAGGLGLAQQALELAAGLAASALLELEQGHPLQGFDLARILVEDLAQFPFGSAAVIGGAAQVGQQQPQGPAVGLLVGHLLQQVDRFGLAIEAQQQAEEALAIQGGGRSAPQPALELAHFGLHLQLQLALGAGAGGAAALAQPPAGPGTAGQQGDQGQALQGGSPADPAWRDSGGFSRTGSRGHGGGRAPLGSSLGPAALATLARGPRTPARPGGSSDDASPSDFTGYRTDAVPGHRGGPGDLSAQ